MKKQSYIRFVVLCIILAVLTFGDQISKFVAVAELKDKDKIILWKGLLSFEYLENRGAAWGVLSGRIIFLTLLTIFFTLILFVIIIKIEKAVIRTKDKIKLFSVIQVLLVLLAAGALGNLIDRLRFGYVVDFIQFEFMDFPIFNIADCYVTVSALILVVILLFFLKEEDIGKIKG
ncbi:MAG: signal peptidase II [Lachnospiraceae bacterium]|nr:signal peptidase II [Lachnospiraceae bacterium]